MSTVSQIIYKVRTLIKQHTDDSPYTDEFLYSLIKQETSVVMNQKAKKFYKISDWNYRCFCVELELVNSHDCSCVPIGCQVLRTKYKIPKPIVARNRPLLYLKTLGEKRIDIQPQNYIEMNKYDPIKSKAIQATVYNDYILVWNDTQLPLIVVCSVPEDITLWSDIQACGLEEGVTCYDINNDEYLVDSELESLVIKKVLEFLAVPLSIPEDFTNDSNENIKA